MTDIRRQCVICREMFVGEDTDDPVCADCFYANASEEDLVDYEDYRGGGPEADYWDHNDY